jgi:hypothetical protein|tara:strand:+ start:3173 stop:4057 length:885 start_codon:yes stop_codon:yes gene_type:complete
MGRQDEVVAHIDVDPLCYSIGNLTNEHPFVKDAEGNPEKMPVSAEAVHTKVDEHLEQIQEEAGCSSSVLFLSTGGVSTNFRTDLAVTYPYKGRRVGVKPYHHRTVVEYFKSLPNCRIADNREADDDLADAQTLTSVLCTIDKDLNCVVGNHYNYKSKQKYTTTMGESFHFLMNQLLIGDWSTDAILGCAVLEDGVYGPKAKKAGQPYSKRSGVGPKEAENILLGCDNREQKLDAVKNQYKKLFGDGWEDKIDEMLNLLHMGGSANNLQTHKSIIHEYDKRYSTFGQTGAGEESF